MSLQYNNPFSKNISLASAVQLPFRTDSKPLRRRFVGKTGFGTCRQKTLLNFFRQSFESWVAGLRPVCFLVTFCTTQKVTTRSPSQEVSRFCKPQISAPQWQLRAATIKTFLRKLRGSANLESAHQNSKFAQTKLNPFPLRGCFFRFALLSPPAAAVFFPPYGGPMLLPQHFLPPAAAHKRTATRSVAVLSNALRAPSMHDSRSDSPIAISKSPCTYPLSRILPSNRVIPLPWSDRNSIPPHRPHAAAQ